MAGGLHHAHPGYASGFCIYNDAAVAIASIRKKFGARVLYVDFDAHHGDGVQDVFYKDADVLTVSFHESGTYLFPGTGDRFEAGRGPGFGFSVNVPFEPMTSDEVFLGAFDALMPLVVDAFRPDLIVTQMGCDPHFNDPLAHLLVTMGGFRALYRKTHKLAHEMCGGRWVAVGGGGYQVHTIVPRAWTMLYAEMCEMELSNNLPAEWVERTRQFDDDDEPVSEHLLDDRTPNLTPERIATTRAAAMESIEYIKSAVLPVIRRNTVY
jgi:acetoin utilization protein AcuC